MMIIIIRDFEIQTGHLISARRPDLNNSQQQPKNKKKTWWIVDFALPADHSKFERKWKEGFWDINRSPDFG